MSNNDVRKPVFDMLDLLGLEYGLLEHPAVFTQEDSELRGIDSEGLSVTIYKNLFLRNKKKTAYYLISLPLEKRADLKTIAKMLGKERLSFASESDLYERLHIRPGSVSFLNIAGAAAANPDGWEKGSVKFIIDKEAFTHEHIGVHPNDNTATVLLAPKDIHKIFEHYKADQVFMELG
ncbi:MAG: prolyl-tRNA synthetase associated domain-containing protein [Clostridiales Family XIII bacterium]|jgi:Ala-tRNA(Pro) deacylase|nr:prolyl-tRNA synthetase associated domain-containing protein [Clostridiales Family XIII bacterium]